jgi:hypothetical protein
MSEWMLRSQLIEWQTLLHPTHTTTIASCAPLGNNLERAPNPHALEPQFKISSYLGSFLFFQPKPHTNKCIFFLSVMVFPNWRGEYLVSTLHWSLNVHTKYSPVQFGKTITLRKNIHLFASGFGWDNKN